MYFPTITKLKWCILWISYYFFSCFPVKLHVSFLNHFSPANVFVQAVSITADLDASATNISDLSSSSAIKTILISSELPSSSSYHYRHYPYLLQNWQILFRFCVDIYLPSASWNRILHTWIFIYVYLEDCVLCFSLFCLMMNILVICIYL